MEEAQHPPKKEKNNLFLAHIRKDWMVYAVLLLALFALLWTWNQQLTIEQRIRADYEDYIEQCHIQSGGGIQWNGTLNSAYYTPSADS